MGEGWETTVQEGFILLYLKIGPGSLMSLYGPTFHVPPVDLCIIFQCNIYILYHVLWK